MSPVLTLAGQCSTSQCSTTHCSTQSQCRIKQRCTTAEPFHYSRRRRQARRRPAPLQACCQHTARREVVLNGVLVMPALLTQLLTSNDSVDVEPKVGQCADCVGEVDGTLNSCGTLPSCVSTFDDRPPHFIAPWSYDGQQAMAQAQLVAAIQAAGGQAQVLQQSNIKQAAYVRGTLPSRGSGLLRSSGTLDVEFVFSSEDDSTVALRAAPRVQPRLALLDGDGGVQDTLQSLRLALGWEEVFVQRNRRRVLFFGESPWDDYGPTPPAGGVEYGKSAETDFS